MIGQRVNDPLNEPQSIWQTKIKLIDTFLLFVILN